LIAPVLTTKNDQTQHYIHQKHKRNRKTALANKTIYTLIWYGFYDLLSGNGVGPILTAPEPTRGKHIQGGPKNQTVFLKFVTPVYVDIE